MSNLLIPLFHFSSAYSLHMHAHVALLSFILRNNPLSTNLAASKCKHIHVDHAMNSTPHHRYCALMDCSRLCLNQEEVD